MLVSLMKIAGKIVGNIGYNQAELTRADLTQADLTPGRVDPHSLYLVTLNVFNEKSHRFSCNLTNKMCPTVPTK